MRSKQVVKVMKEKKSASAHAEAGQVRQVDPSVAVGTLLRILSRAAPILTCDSEWRGDGRECCCSSQGKRGNEVSQACRGWQGEWRQTGEHCTGRVGRVQQ